jgi:two-component system response regulator YesN
MIRILIVDDEREIADHIARLTEETAEGNAVLEVVYSGTRALKCLQAQPFDILITDIVMPVTDGFKLLEYVASENLKTEVIFLSAYREFDYIYRANKIKKITYIVKTEEDALIRKVIAGAIDRIIIRSSGYAPEDEAEADSLYPEQKKERELIQNIQRYIVKHIDNNLTAADIAEKFHYHPAYLSKLFSLYGNEKLSSYILKAKIEKAKWYLTDTEYTISDIAAMLGYQSSQAFGRAFRREVDLSPQEYRHNTQI